MAALAHSDEASPKSRERADAELKRRLVDHLDLLRRPNDLLRVTQVSKHHFRVNTLTPTTKADGVMNTYQITKSQFLHAEDRAGELVITDQTRR